MCRSVGEELNYDIILVGIKPITKSHINTDSIEYPFSFSSVICSIMKEFQVQKEQKKFFKDPTLTECAKLVLTFVKAYSKIKLEKEYAKKLGLDTIIEYECQPEPSPEEESKVIPKKLKDSIISALNDPKSGDMIFDSKLAEYIGIEASKSFSWWKDKLNVETSAKSLADTIKEQIISGAFSFENLKIEQEEEEEDEEGFTIAK